MKARQPLSLKARAVALLAQRDHSELELRRKLARIARDIAARSAAASGDGDGEDHEPAPDLDEPEDGERGQDGERQIEAVLVWLREQGYLDETRFVESRVHARASRWGQRRIEQELAQHGLSLDAEQRASLAGSELSRACELLLRKFGATPPEDPSAEARQMRFLLGRGFGPDLCRRALRAIRSSDLPDDTAPA